MQLLAPLVGPHYQESEPRPALVAAAEFERLTADGRSERALHYDALPAWLWREGEIVADGRGNDDLRVFVGDDPRRVSASCDLHFARADLERFRGYLIAIRAAPLPDDVTQEQPGGAVIQPGGATSRCLRLLRHASAENRRA
jgi:hypothetical protein